MLLCAGLLQSRGCFYTLQGHTTIRCTPLDVLLNSKLKNPLGATERFMLSAFTAHTVALHCHSSQTYSFDPVLSHYTQLSSATTATAFTTEYHSQVNRNQGFKLNQLARTIFSSSWGMASLCCQLRTPYMGMASFGRNRYFSNTPQRASSTL